MENKINWKEYVVSIEDHNQNNGFTLHLHINEKGKIIRIYTFKDEIPEFCKIDSDGEFIYDKYGDYKYISLATKPSKINPLFVDLKISQILPYLDCCYFDQEDVDNFENQTDTYLIEAVKKYKKLSL